MADTAKIQATINGTVVTIAEIALSVNASISGFETEAISGNFTRPLLIDAGTAINLVTVQSGTDPIASACVYTIAHER